MSDVPHKREQSQTCLNSAEREGLRPQGNVPHLRFPEFRGEWEKYTIGELCEEFKSGKNIKAENIKEEGGAYPVFGGNGLRGYTDRFNHDGEYVLIGRQGALCGNVRFVTGKTYITEHAIAAKATTDNYTRYLEYLFIRLNLGQFSDQSAQPGLAVNKLLKIEAFVPSKAEQIKIASLLMHLDERIATQNKVIEKLESLIKGVSQRLLSPKQSWTSYRLDELCQIKSGYSGTQVSFHTAYKVSRIETISKHCVDMSRIGYVKDIPQEYKLNVGDILFSNINSVQYIGNTAFIDKDYGLYHGMNLLRIIPNSNIVFPRFIHLLLCTDRLLRHFQSVCNKAVSQASINQTSLGKTIISIPSYGEQQHICRIIGSIERKLDIEINLLKMLQNQKQYLLRQMFV